MLQRALAAHPDIATASEPWLLLPFIYLLRPTGAYAEYSHELLSIALTDFLHALPNGDLAYREALREFVLRLYGLAAGERRHFLDKTPRYHLIVEDLLTLFPDARFVFLWRHPLSIVASIIETWGEGRFNLFHSQIDLYEGVARLAAAFASHRARCCAVRYEDLLTQPEMEINRILAHIGLQPDPGLLERFTAVRLEGRLGDPTGTKRYADISQEPLDKWKRTLATPVRKWWAKRYLKWIGPDRMAVMGYDLQRSLDELDGLSTRGRRVVSDVVWLLYSLSHAVLEPKMFRDKIRQVARGARLYPHR